jgi:tetratricopeptide (TPR) repeat protein
MSVGWVKRKWLRRRARYNVRRGDFPSALAYCERVLSLIPEDAYLLCCAGYCHSNLQHYEDAAKLYDRALQVNPNYGDAHAMLGRALLYMHRPQEAMESFTRAFRMQPKLQKCHAYQVAFAKANGDVGKTEAALAAYREAARLDSKDAEALAGIGWALMELGHYKDAEQPLQKAIKLDPDYSSPYLSLAYVLQELNRHGESIPLAERFIALEPADSDGHVRLG